MKVFFSKGGRFFVLFFQEQPKDTTHSESSLKKDTLVRPGLQELMKSTSGTYAPLLILSVCMPQCIRHDASGNAESQLLRPVSTAACSQLALTSPRASSRIPLGSFAPKRHQSNLGIFTASHRGCVLFKRDPCSVLRASPCSESKMGPRPTA